MDRILMSIEWNTKFPIVKVEGCNWLTLDHVPLKLTLGEKEKIFKRIFRFEKI